MDAINFLNIVMCYSPSFSPLAGHLCRTLSYPQIKIHAKLAEFGSEGFKTPGWYKFVRMKVEMLQKMLFECEEGCVVGMIDSDVQCFSPESVFEVWRSMVLSNYDYLSFAELCHKEMNEIWFEPKGEESNTGFVLIRNNKKTQFFLQDVLSKTFEEKFLGDQSAINESLRQINLKRVLLNPHLFFHGCCGIPQKKIILHHATCGANAQQKIEQMNRVRQQLDLDQVQWSDSSFGSSCV